jgi:hypothetical protein
MDLDIRSDKISQKALEVIIDVPSGFPKKQHYLSLSKGRVFHGVAPA